MRRATRLCAKQEWCSKVSVLPDHLQHRSDMLRVARAVPHVATCGCAHHLSLCKLLKVAPATKCGSSAHTPLIYVCLYGTHITVLDTQGDTHSTKQVIVCACSGVDVTRIATDTVSGTTAPSCGSARVSSNRYSSMCLARRYIPLGMCVLASTRLVVVVAARQDLEGLQHCGPAHGCSQPVAVGGARSLHSMEKG